MNRIIKKCLVSITIVFSCLANVSGQKTSTKDEVYQISSSGLTVSFSADGEIKSLAVNGKDYKKTVLAYTTVAGCRQEGTIIVKKSDNKMISFERHLVHDSLQKRCVLVDKFISTATGIRWELLVKGTDEPWSSLIQTRIQYPAAKSTLFWTTWGAPQYDPSTVNASVAKRLREYPLEKNHDNRQFDLTGNIVNVDKSQSNKNNGWVDPLIPIPFSNVNYDYGAPYFTYKTQGFSFPCRNSFCISAATVIEPEYRLGLTFALSPEDEIINLTMKTTAQGDIVFNRLFNRISYSHECLFSLDITVHADDWRSALAWMSNRYPEYFNPPNPQAINLCGTGAYSGHSVEFDTEKMKKMCLTVNWSAHFDFPYMGMFLPPLGVNEQWDSFKGEKTSIKIMNDYAAEMKKRGFYVFNYFNVTEFGGYVEYPCYKYYQGTYKKEENLWKHSSQYLYEKFPNAILPRPDTCVTRPDFKGAAQGEPWYSWFKCVAMDCGDESYRKFLLNQAQRYVNEIPDAYGICIDRLDWTIFFNERVDDGITWFEGKPVRSLVTSWKRLMEDMRPIFHTSGKYIFTNNHSKRIDYLKHVDGLFDEFTYGFGGVHLNLMAFLCINKPALGWTDKASTVKKEGGDTFFQKYLYLGVFPMCPFPGNDHSIRPDPEVDQIYLDYSPLMRQMQNRKWVLEPHAVSVENNLAKVNIFKIPDGYSIPVVYGENNRVRVKIANIEGLSKQTICEAYYPGKETPSELKMTKSGNVWYVDVPLEKGCTMLKLRIKR